MLRTNPGDLVWIRSDSRESHVRRYPYAVKGCSLQIIVHHHEMV